METVQHLRCATANAPSIECSIQTRSPLCQLRPGLPVLPLRACHRAVALRWLLLRTVAAAALRQQRATRLLGSLCRHEIRQLLLPLLLREVCHGSHEVLQQHDARWCILAA